MAENSRYVVLSDALVVTVGKKANGTPAYTRVLRGGVINGKSESETIQDFLGKGAVRLVKDDAQLQKMQDDLKLGTGSRPLNSKLRQTVQKAAQAMGAPGDPVKAPDPDFAPVSGEIVHTSPDEIMADAE